VLPLTRDLARLHATLMTIVRVDAAQVGLL
jgi:hypothetical protein